MKYKASTIVAIIVALSVLTFAGVQLGSYLYARMDDAAVSDEMIAIADAPIDEASEAAQAAEIDADESLHEPELQNKLRNYTRRLFGRQAPGNSPISGNQTTKSLADAQRRRINFTALRRHNTHIVGWISVPNMPIDYPILRANDNSFYLTRNAKRQRSSAGSIFLDSKARTNFTSSDTIVYGHDMRDGSKFGTLNRFRNRTFRNRHQFIYVYTPTATRKYRVSTAWRTTAVNLTPDRSNRLTLTLVTCEGRGAHYVVRAVLVSTKRPGAK